jgi:uncharacterized protein
MATSPHTNRLVRETSPYLLQHAHNPVDWYPWGEEALQAARTQDKPILVSIGYSACHWCHVMERESFEDAGTARFMNEHFINIKVDREERPDLDHIYMDAVQTITGSGGWPLNVFLTPDTKPFYGGTYFPPRPIHNRNSWQEVLAGVSAAFRERRAEVEQQADALTQHVAAAGSFGIGESSAANRAKDPATSATAEPADRLFRPETLAIIRDRLLASADKLSGGFGGAPKFPQTFSIRYLLYDYYYTRNTASLDQACLSLDKMIRGGIYDQLGGGFARYSTDREWLVPHFEKMLYDNALLVTTLCEAFQLCKKQPGAAGSGSTITEGHDRGGARRTSSDEGLQTAAVGANRPDLDVWATRAQLYREAIEETLAFACHDLSNGQGGYYAALDADSEGIEGKYYVWTAREIDEVLGPDAGAFKAFYDVTGEGNWEGHTILTRKGDDPLPSQVASARSRLLEYRSRRIPPGLDDKILLGWNALMNIAFSKAYAALGNDSYRDMAVAGMRFLRQQLGGGSAAVDAANARHIHRYSHTWKGEARIPAFLDDYACLISALLHLQEITGVSDYLREAEQLTQYVIDHFSETDTGFFLYTHQAQRDVILRKREIYDGATPSGNSMMASNLMYLAIATERPEWMERARQMAASLERAVTGYPGSFGGWATLFQAFTYSIPEVVITGRKPENARKEFLSHLIPFRVFQSTEVKNTQFPLLCNKPVETDPLIFLCKGYSCQTPVNEVAVAIRNLENVHKFQP